MTSIRETVMRQFRRTLREQNGFLVGAAVGTGMTARAAETGGADFLLALTAGRMRMMGAPSMASHLPVADSNALAESFAAAEVLSQCTVPVFLGLSALNPQHRLGTWIERAADAGFPGIVNWPTSVLYPPAIRTLLDESGIGFRREIELLGTAREAGLAAVAYVGTTEQALQAIHAGIEVICVNLGWTTGGRTGLRSEVVIEDIALGMRNLSRSIRRVAPRALILVEGGPLETAEQVGSVLRDAHFHGFVGGSSLERLPIEDAVAARTWTFKHTARQLAESRLSAGTLSDLTRSHDLGGLSEASRTLMLTLYRAARQSHAVLLSGEPGTPIQHAAEIIHREAGHAPETLVTISARRLTAAQFDKRVYGLAGEGEPGDLANPQIESLVIQDIERLSARQHARIARYIRDGWFSPTGLRHRIRANVRLILTITDHPGTDRGTGTLDPELAAALEGHEIRIAPLRDRRDDIEELLRQAIAKRRGEELTLSIDDRARRALLMAAWPGNDAELESFAAQLAADDHNGKITMSDVGAIADQPPLRAASRRANERDMLLDALWRHQYHRENTARALGVSRKTLYNKMKRHGLLYP